MIVKRQLHEAVQLANNVEFMAQSGRENRVTLIGLLNSKQPDSLQSVYGLEMSPQDLEAFRKAKPEGKFHEIGDVRSYQYFTKGKPSIEFRIFSEVKNQERP